MPVNMNRVVNIIPKLIRAIGSGYKESGLLLTQDLALPYGQVFRFQSSDAVSAYFGSASPLVDAARIYFTSHDIKTKLPSELLIANFNLGNAVGWIRGSQIQRKISELNTISNGYITLNVNDKNTLISDIDFTGAVSYTEMAAILQTAIDEISPSLSCTFDLIRQAFLIMGDSSTTLGFAVNSINVGTDVSDILGLTESAGAIISDPHTGNIAISDVMDNICLDTENWLSFTTDWLPDLNSRLEFGAWNSSKYNGARFIYCEYDTDGAVLTAASNADFASLAAENGYVAILPIYGQLAHAMFALSCGAAVNRAETNGRYALAGKHQAGLPVTIDNSLDFDILITKGYSCYADFATAGNRFRWFQNGAILGPYKWFDALQGHVWLNDNIQVNSASIIDQIKAFPYNNDGFAMIDSALSEAANLALNNGVATRGVMISDSQKNLILAELGQDISDTLFAAGFYNHIVAPTADIRLNRGSPIVRFYYNDGGVIQKIDVISSSIA